MLRPHLLRIKKTANVCNCSKSITMDKLLNKKYTMPDTSIVKTEKKLNNNVASGKIHQTFIIHSLNLCMSLLRYFKYSSYLSL